MRVNGAALPKSTYRMQQGYTVTLKLPAWADYLITIIYKISNVISGCRYFTERKPEVFTS
jgi:hypothetical protein